jgi:phage repressor protein C with HTH and peptisase S24 domain
MIKERVIQIVEQKGIIKEDFFPKIGMTSANFRGNARNTPLNSNAIENILSELPDVNPEWLLTGKGEMLKEATNNEITKIHKPTKYMEKIIEAQEITLYDISAAANLKTLFVQKNQNILGKITLPNIPKCDGAMYVTGDSMDPIIKSGDIICYKEIYDFNNIIYGEMYIVSIDMEGDEYLSVKYITRSDKGDAWVRLESHNKRHSPKDFELKYVNALALVKISIRMNTMG